jgi:tetratricopeptide (TPR) repeat protein
MAPERRSRLLLIAIIAVLLFLAYARSLGNQFVYDDRHLILENPLVRDAGKLPAVFGEEFYRGLTYYRPLPLISFIVEYRLWGPSPQAFHLTNIVLIAATGIVLFLVLSRMFAPRRVGLALFATLLVCLHPVMSSVALAVGARADLLAMPLLLFALFFYLRGGAASFILSILCFGLALLSKETAVTFPVLILALEALGLHAERRITMTGQTVLRHLPFWVLLAAYFAIRSAVLADTAGTFTLKGMSVLKSYAYLLQTSIVPGIGLVYEPRFEDWFSPFRLAVAGAVSAILLLAVVRAGRERAREAAFWLLWAVITYLPTSNIVKQETTWDERYLALPLIGIVSFACVAAGSLRRRDRRLTRAKLISGVGLLIVFTAITLGRSAFWKDDLAFFTQWRETSPYNPRPHNNLGIVYREMGKLRPAMECFEEAIAADSSYVRAYNNLGLARATLGRYDEAIRLYLEATEIDSTYGVAFYNLATAYGVTGRPDSALKAYEKALRIHPGWARALYEAGHTCLRIGKLDDAGDYFRRSIAAEPRMPGAYFGLSLVLERQGLLDEAIEAMKDGLERAPHNEAARERLGKLLEEAAVEGS